VKPRPSPSTHDLFEIVPRNQHGLRRPRGLVFCDPQAPSTGWALVVIVPDQRTPIPEIRIHPICGFERVVQSAHAFELRPILRDVAEAKHADLLPLVRSFMPNVVRGIAVSGVGESPMMPFSTLENPVDDEDDLEMWSAPDEDEGDVTAPFEASEHLANLTSEERVSHSSGRQLVDMVEAGFGWLKGLFRVSQQPEAEVSLPKKTFTPPFVHAVLLAEAPQRTTTSP
jgi:hypothetical protein